MENNNNSNKEDETALGPWLREFQKQNTSTEKAAELILGLLFASHKNPSIGCAQSFLYLVTHSDETECEHVTREAQSTLSSSKQLAHSNLEQLCPHIHRCVMETLRVTAHTIGAIRFVKQDMVLQSLTHGNFLLKEGDTIAISHIVPNLDVNVWGDDASVYNLNRKEWMLQQQQQPQQQREESKKNVAGGGDKDNAAAVVDEYKFTTFSQGIHKCPGQRIAEVSICSMMAILVGNDARISHEKKENIPKISFERATLAQRDGLVKVNVLLKL